MNSKQYKIVTNFNNEKYIHSIDGMFPMSEDNKDYQEYLKWVSEGNIAEEWVAE
jgi:hypothetical protein